MVKVKLLNFVDYKSAGASGFGVMLVKPNGTSSKCAICGSKLIP